MEQKIFDFLQEDRTETPPEADKGLEEWKRKKSGARAKMTAMQGLPYEVKKKRSELRANNGNGRWRKRKRFDGRRNMAKKKKMMPEQELRKCRDDLMGSYERWGDLRLNGGSDPAWPDGVNMELARCHIIDDQRRTVEICTANGLPYPPEISLPVPPEAPKGYMAGLEQTERVKRLQAMGFVLTTDLGGAGF